MLMQLLATTAATRLTFFAFPSVKDPFLAAANRCGKTGHRENSTIFQWNEKQFELSQTIPTKGAYDWEFFSVGTNGHFLVVANHWDERAVVPRTRSTRSLSARRCAAGVQ